MPDPKDVHAGLESLAGDLLAFLATPHPSDEHLELVEARMATHLVNRRSRAAVDVFAAVREAPRQFIRRGRMAADPMKSRGRA